MLTHWRAWLGAHYASPTQVEARVFVDDAYAHP